MKKLIEMLEKSGLGMGISWNFCNTYWLMCTCGRAVVIRLAFIVFLSFEIKENYRWPLETDPKCKMKSLVMFFVWPKLIFFSFDLNYLWTPLWSYLRFSKNVWFFGMFLLAQNADQTTLQSKSSSQLQSANSKLWQQPTSSAEKDH